MEAYRHARSTSGVDRALLGCFEDRQANKTEATMVRSRQKEAIRVEVNRLLAASFIKEVYHPEWLANPVLVRKKNNKWRMCVDYIDLNKHCPKDPFGLPRIDEVVDSTASYELLSFLDCYSSYHQISLRVEDQIKTSMGTSSNGCWILAHIRSNSEAAQLSSRRRWSTSLSNGQI
jgi:hypothetical protein